MGELWNKISSYNIFNNLLPGALYVYFIEKVSHLILSSGDIVKDIILYYFIGLVIGRFGSVIFEPTIKKLKVVHFEPYDKYIVACRVDSKVEVLQEVANMYRTLSSMFIVIILSLLFIMCITGDKYTLSIFIFFAFSVLFLISYVKQTKFIITRIQKANTP